MNPALLALAIGGFCIGTTEFAAMSLLPWMAGDLGVSVPVAGWAISSYALGVVVGAPLLTILAARWNRKHLLLGLMGLYALANAATAFAPSFGWVVFERFLAGLPHGAFFGVGAVVAAHVAGPGRRGQAVAVMMIGLTIANIVGVPLATWMGQFLGWRSAFLAAAALGLISWIGVAAGTPSVPVASDRNVLSEIKALKNGPLWLVFAAGAVGFGGMFAVYSYVVPLLTGVSGIPASVVPWVLALFGLGMTLGTLWGGKSSDKSVNKTVWLGFGTTALVLLLIALVAPWAWPAALSIGALGIVTQILGLSLQARLMDLSPRAPSLGAALCHAGLNVGNASGAWFGGLVLSAGWGSVAPAWVGLGLTIVGAGLYALAPRQIKLDDQHESLSKTVP